MTFDVRGGRSKMNARRPQRSREETRQMLLAAGRDILRDEGLGTGAEAITFKRVFDRVERETGVRLTNASVIHRVFENQAEFQADLLVSIAVGQNHADIDDAV